jgi:septin family protein
VVLLALVCHHYYSSLYDHTQQSARILTLRRILVGRTTFVNTLCGKKVLEGKDADDATNAHLEEGVRIKPVTVGMIHPPNDSSLLSHDAY